MAQYEGSTEQQPSLQATGRTTAEVTLSVKNEQGCALSRHMNQKSRRCRFSIPPPQLPLALKNIGLLWASCLLFKSTSENPFLGLEDPELP